MTNASHRNDWIDLVIFLIVCLSAGGLGAIATTPEIEGWYKTINKPSWNPPDYVFGPVWTTLFIMMAIAAWLVWKPAGFNAAKVPLSLFSIQLVLNAPGHGYSSDYISQAGRSWRSLCFGWRSRRRPWCSFAARRSPAE